MTFDGLEDRPLDHLYDGDEGDRIGEHARNIEELEIELDLKADAVAPPQQFDHEHDLPDQGEARARRHNEKGRELRQDDVPHAAPGTEAERAGHVGKVPVERPHALAQRNDDQRQLVQGHRADRGHLRQPEPDICKHSDDERRQIEQEQDPTVEGRIHGAPTAHEKADQRPDRHRQPEADQNAEQGHPEVMKHATLRDLIRQGHDDRRCRRELTAGRKARGSFPDQEEQNDRAEADGEVAGGDPHATLNR
jgi:hypothetical protein